MTLDFGGQQQCLIVWNSIEYCCAYIYIYIAECASVHTLLAIDNVLHVIDNISIKISALRSGMTVKDLQTTLMCFA